MAFTLDSIVPWGRSFEEYQHMFALSQNDLSLRILGCGDGPASFNAEATRRGVSVISVDPMYAYDADDIEHRMDETYEDVLEQLTQNQQDYNWDGQTPEDISRRRLQAMHTFLDDFGRAKRGTRYVADGLPDLPFENDAFDLALCSHFLFLYSNHLTASFHVASVKEMLRVANEVRVFPLLTLGGEPSSYVKEVIKFCREQDFNVERVEGDYDFQKGANEMLTIRHV